MFCSRNPSSNPNWGVVLYFWANGCPIRATACNALTQLEIETKHAGTIMRGMPSAGNIQSVLRAGKRALAK